jgi:hypothetical protein
MRKVLLGALVALLVCGVGFAAGNRGRDLEVEMTTAVQIGICQPEVIAATTLGWDQNPTSGGWGGKPEADFAVVWEPGTPDVAALSGRMAQCTIAGSFGMTPATVRINHLEGLANDDFCVFASTGAGYLLVGCHDEVSTSEVWKTTSFTLPAGAYAAGQDVTIKILATGNAWASISTWGQLGVDWIEILD